MSPDRPVYHVVQRFVLKRAPDGTLFELPERLVPRFESALHGIPNFSQAFTKTINELRQFNQYIVH